MPSAARSVRRRPSSGCAGSRGRILRRFPSCSIRSGGLPIIAGFTFVLAASARIPDKALERRRTIGIRIPDNSIPRAIVERLGAPLLTSSVLDDEETEYMTDPELIHERYGRDVELVIDGGVGDAVPTTVVDLTGGEPEILREGKGVLRE